MVNAKGFILVRGKNKMFRLKVERDGVECEAPILIALGKTATATILLPDDDIIWAAVRENLDDIAAKLSEILSVDSTRILLETTKNLGSE